MRAQATNAIIVTEDLTFPAGAMLYASEILSELREKGWQLAVWTDRKPANDDELSSKADWHECPEFFRDGHGLAGRLRRRRAEMALVRLTKSYRPMFCLILCDVPRPAHRRLSRWTNVVFFIHGVAHTCPQNSGLRYLPKSRVICADAAGLACLKTDRTEGCLGARPVWRKLQRIWRVRRGLRAIGKLDTVVANSRYVAESYRSNQAGMRLRVLEPYVRQCNATSTHVREETARFNLLYIGRIETYKGALEAIEILSLLPSGYRLTLIGSGDEIQQVRDRAEALRLSGRVEIIGWLGREQLSQRLNQGGLLLMPALCAEAFGMTGPEALCSGIPVLAYDVGGVASWCDGVAAVRVPVGDRTAAANAILDLTSHSARWQGVCLVARRYGRERFAVNHWRSGLYELLNPSGDATC